MNQAAAPGSSEGSPEKPESNASLQELRGQSRPADLRAFLSRHSHLSLEKSLVLDLAYEEYCQCQEAGESPDPDEFCERFPNFETSLRRLIAAHRFLEENPHLLGEERAVHWPEPGSKFLGFSLISELGRGAFARVFLAEEPALGKRWVAVKVSQQGAAEAETLGRLNHPNIVPVHSVQQDQVSGLTVVCMPYLGRATLCDVLDKVFSQRLRRPSRARFILDAVQDTSHPEIQPLGGLQRDLFLMQAGYVNGVIHIAAQLAEALAYIHSLGICHRDLKPSNVLMSPAGRPMLLDFNLSSDAQVEDQRLGGTVPYMSPEQLEATDPGRKADPSSITARSDLFSLGVILHELLTGVHPFGPISLKSSLPELRRQLLERQQGGPRPIRQANPQVPTSLARIIERCLAFEPEGRPSSAAELVGTLRKNLTPLRRLRHWASLHPILVIGCTLLTLAASFAGAYALVTHQLAKPSLMEEAREAYRNGKFDQALECSERAIAADQNNFQALLLNARIRQQRGEFSLALDEYQKADKLQRDGQVKAGIGDCFSRLMGPKQAIQSYEEALDCGFVNAEVFNNLGYNDIVLGDLDKAKQNLDQAIARNAGLQSAFHNRAIVELRKARTPAYVPTSGLVDIKEAIRLGPPTADLYYVAACLSGLVAKKDPLQVEQTLDYAEKAVNLGQDPASLKNVPPLRVLWNDPGFQVLVARKADPSRKPIPAVRLVDSVKDIPS